MRLLFDANSYLNPALLRGVDHDDGRVVTGEDGKQIQVNGWRHGVDGFWEKVEADLKHFEVAPRQCVLVWDGANAKQMRRTFLDTYKVGRDKSPEVSEQLNLARAHATSMALHLGMHVVHQDGMEADDVLAYLAATMRTQRNVICTGDGDLCALVDENTDVWRQGELNKNPYGPFPHKHILVYKSLVGDTSDKIPGAKLFGDQAFVDFVRIFGLDALDDMLAMIENGTLDELRDSVQYHKPLQRIIDSKDMVACSWRAAKMYPERVNTLRKPLEIHAGMVAQWSDLDSELRVESLRRFYGTKTLVTAANFDDVLKRFQGRVDESPFVALDIETSESDESIEWVERLKALTENDRDRFDTLGHELAGMSLTFGANTQHTIYMSVDHKDTANITVDQCRQMCEQIPQRKHIIVQNRHFEFTVLYRTWAEKWLDNGWHGFLPNAIDTKIGANYVDENFPTGLKQRSLMHLGYKQATFEETMRVSGPPGTLTGGRIVGEVKTEAGDTHEVRQYRMHEVTAQHVFAYGCDDTICTAALHTHYQFVMELEHTWDTYLQVEQLPEYLTSLAFVQGFPISLAKLREMEQKDDVRYAAAWVTLREYLMGHGWDGTVCPEFDEEQPLEPSDVKLICQVLLDTDEVQYTTKKRKLNAMSADIRTQFPDNAIADLIATMVEQGNIKGLNKMVKDHFTGEPKIKFNSPKQMQNLFYRVIGITPRIFNKMTQKERDGNEAMREGFKKVRRAKDIKVDVFSLTEPAEGMNSDGRHVKVDPLTSEEREALIAKASTDDTAVDWALAKDSLAAGARAVLEAYKAVRTILTRRSLFYRPYKALGHWRDGLLHPSMNQSEAVTRRYSSSNPNANQLPKRGEGVEFRQVVIPHKNRALVVSLDFSAQELRDMAEWSGDVNLTACYVGDNLKDAHSLTAVAAAPSLWGREVTYEEFIAQLKCDDPVLAKKAKDLRGDGKTVNFASQYDAMAPKIAETLLTDEETAQIFLDAKDRAMPRIGQWKEEVREEVERLGYATTRMGARRHLQSALRSENKWEVQRAGRQGPNHKIQGSGAEQTKLAMGSMWLRELFVPEGKYDARFYFPAHDEVVFSVVPEDALALIKEVHECMTQPYGGKKIPIVSSISIGLNFGQQIECGDFYDPQAIAAALKEVSAA